ncbi:hypothetical protein, partial [Escherichia coli]|uniref:hypothetical protein n=1 Tax=Escherichia coli TaxID=562 RepID=UPI001BC8897B
FISQDIHTYHRRINAVFYCLICRFDSLFGEFISQDIHTYHRRINAVFYCLICRFDSLFGDSTHATRTTA